MFSGFLPLACFIVSTPSSIFRCICPFSLPTIFASPSLSHAIIPCCVSLVRRLFRLSFHQRGQSTVDTRRYGGRERRESRTTDERKRWRTSEAQHGMLTWDQLGRGEDRRERKRTNTPVEGEVNFKDYLILDQCHDARIP